MLVFGKIERGGKIVKILHVILLMFFSSFLFLGCAKKTQNMQVIIDTEPKDAMIKESSLGIEWRSGKEVTLPYKKKGTYTVGISKEGYEQVLQTFPANRKNYYKFLTLKKLKTTVDFNIQPNSAQTQLICNNVVFKGNAKIYISKELFKNSNVMECELKVSADGFIPLDKKVKIKKYVKQTLSAALSENVITLQINSQPSLVDVYVKGYGYLGTTPFTYKLDANTMQRLSTFAKENTQNKTVLYMIFKKKGYEEKVVPVWLNKNHIETVNVKLNKK